MQITTWSTIHQCRFGIIAVGDYSGSGPGFVNEWQELRFYFYRHQGHRHPFLASKNDTIVLDDTFEIVASEVYHRPCRPPLNHQLGAWCMSEEARPNIRLKRILLGGFTILESRETASKISQHVSRSSRICTARCCGSLAESGTRLANPSPDLTFPRSTRITVTGTVLYRASKPVLSCSPVKAFCKSCRGIEARSRISARGAGTIEVCCERVRRIARHYDSK